LQVKSQLAVESDLEVFTQTSSELRKVWTASYAS